MHDWKPFEWVEIEPELLSPINELCGRRHRFAFRCAGSDFTLRLGPPSAAGSVTAGLQFEVQGMRAWLGLPSFSFVGELDAEMAPYWCGEEAGEGELGRIAVEVVWEPFSKVLEAAGAGCGRLRGMGAAPDAECSVRFLLEVGRGGLPWFRGPLALEPRLAEFWGEAARRAPVARRKLAGELPVWISLEVGRLVLELATLRRLKRGDVLLSEEPFPGVSMVLKVEGIPWGEAVLDETGTKSMIRIVPNDNLTKDERAEGDSDAPSLLEAIPISLSFELGRRRVSLGELETLKEGFIFELDREAKRPVLILANGRVIGTGELVKVGERVGVRVVELRAESIS